MKKYILSSLILFCIGGSVHAQTCSTGANSGTNAFFSLCEAGSTGSTFTSVGNYTFSVANKSTLVINGDVTINGTLTIDLGGSDATVIIQSPYTLTADNIVFTGSAGGGTSKVLEVQGPDGQLIVSNEIDFGGLHIEIDGTGTIDAGTITGADNVDCEASGDGTCPTVTADTCTDGTNNFCETALPIVLAHFDVIAQENAVKIKWITTTEENNDYFEILRSRDGVEYEVIATIDGAGNSTQALSYEYLDKNPLFGQSYYKLKQTDFDGKNETFNAKSIYVSTISDLVFAPNPVKAGEPLKIYTGASEEEKVVVSILSLAGNEVHREVLRGEEFSININTNIEKGIYFLKVKSGSNQFVKRLLIK